MATRKPDNRPEGYTYDLDDLYDEETGLFDFAPDAREDEDPPDWWDEDDGGYR